MIHAELTSKKTNSSVSILRTRSVTASCSRLTIVNTNRSLQSIAQSKSNWLLKQQFVSEKINGGIRLKRRQDDVSDLHKRLQLRTLNTTGKRWRSATPKRKRERVLSSRDCYHRRVFFFFFPLVSLF